MSENTQAPAVETTELATTDTTAVIVAKPQSVAFITALIEQNRREFQEANEGLGLDFVRDGEWLKIDKKGNFVAAADETEKFGDSIDVLIGSGQVRYMLWGKDGTPEKGNLILVEETQEAAEAKLGEWLMQNPDRAVDYDNDDISMRYLCMLVMVNDIAEALSDGGIPRVWLHDCPYGDSIGFGKFAQQVHQGKFKVLGVPRKTGANRIVIRITTEDRKAQGSTDSYIGRKFECVGMFNPADFGFQPVAE